MITKLSLGKETDEAMCDMLCRPFVHIFVTDASSEEIDLVFLKGYLPFGGTRRRREQGKKNLIRQEYQGALLPRPNMLR